MKYFIYNCILYKESREKIYILDFESLKSKRLETRPSVIVKLCLDSKNNLDALIEYKEIIENNFLRLFFKGSERNSLSSNHLVVIDKFLNSFK